MIPIENDWLIRMTRQDYSHRNHLLLIANGYVGVRGCFSELFGKDKSSIHVIGIYDQVGYDDPNRDPWHPEKDKWKEIINMPDFMTAPMQFEGEPITLTDGNTSEFNVQLDMRSATLTLEYVWTSARGRRLRIRHERWCAFHHENLVVGTVTVSALDGPGTFIYDAGISGEVLDPNGPHLEQFATGETDDGGFWLTARTQQHHYQVAISSRISADSDVSRETAGNAREIRQRITVALSPDRPVTLTGCHGIFTSRDSMDPLADAQALRCDLSAARAEHLALLERHWDRCDVQIDGDAKAQKYLRYNLYILNISIPKTHAYASIPSRSLSASTYKGAIFWEVDTYAFPFYAYVYPEYARHLLLYRYQALMYAVKKASDLGYDGAYFAWESLDTGEEATKKLVWQDIHSGRMMRNYFGDRQYHIAGDVIYAVWQYYQATGDREFLLRYGAEMTLLTARFVGSLVYYKPARDRYEILHTVCPDEYHEEVDNNTFTNRILRFVLEKAFELIHLLQESAPQQWQQLRQRLKITDSELELWQDIIHKMYIIEPNDRFVIEQHDGYFDLEDISMEEFRSRIIKDEYLGHAIGPAPLTQIIKQADTVQLLVMFKNEYHPIVRRATFDYYDPRTEHGSGDSPNAYGIVAAQAGRLERAYDYFMRSARIDLESTNPKKKANFFLGGVHIAPSGGTWQVIALGFAGIEIRDGLIEFNPVLPRQWQGLRFRFQYRGQQLAIAIDRQSITIRSLESNAASLTVQVNDQPPVTLAPAEQTRQGYRKMGEHYYSY